MKDKTKAKINQIARLIWNESKPTDIPFGYDFSLAIIEFSPAVNYWNMALVAYVECFPRHRDLLRFKI